MSVDILVLFINCFPELTESLSINSYISVSFSQFLKMYHVPLIGPHFLASSYVLYLCIRSHILKTKTKTATSPSTYGLRLYREKSSPVRPVRDSVSLSNLSCGCAFFGLANVNSKLDGFAAFCFSGIINIYPLPPQACLK